MIQNKILFIKISASILVLGLAVTTNVLAMDTPLEDSSEEIAAGSPLSPKQQLKQRAKQGEAQAQYELGMLYRKGTVKKPQKGIVWLEKAADQNHVESQIEVTRMCLNFDNDGLSEDRVKAVKYIRKAVETNHSNAQNILGCLYKEGIGVLKDPEEAVKWFRLAADQNHVQALRNLGWMYTNGVGVPKSTEQAVECYRLAGKELRKTQNGHVDFLSFISIGPV